MPPRFQNSSSRGFSGSWGRGNNRRGHEPNRPRTKKDEPCRFFARRRCTFGERCVYSHDLSSTPASSEFIPPSLEDSSARDAYRAWKRRLRLPPDLYAQRDMEKMWSDALDILSYEDQQDLHQNIPRALVEEDNYGLQWVREVMQMRDSPLHTVGDFLLVATPFLKLVTHPALLDCLSVDTWVGDLYAFISGSSGTRAIPFFQQVCQSLSRRGPADADETIACVVRALREALIRNQKALYHEDVPALVTDIERLCDSADLPTTPSVARTKVQVAELQRLIQRAPALKAEGTRDGATVALRALARSAYPQHIEIPGSRHDNDKANIAQIKIIPTEGEIRCENGDFLPSSNFQTPYFVEGVERLIDIHFRLLRHDIFDEVKNTIAELLHVHENNLGVDQWFRSSMANKSIHTYSGAAVKRLEFTRRRGLEAQLSFLEPRQIAKKSKTEKQQWWANTRRLDEGALLCLVSFHESTSSTFFLTVSEKVVGPGENGSLVPSQGRMSTINAALVPGQATSDLEALVRQFHRTSNVNSILIEFPGVLLATFVPILENLQQMHKESRLPFANWIVPNPQNTLGPLARRAKGDIPPPVYARRPGFAFNLDPILTDRSSGLTLTPTDVGPDVHGKIRQLTSLDEGQCDALTSALTQEFSLIQGPPGTGKSYLGVQLMRVLVANKARAKLGPIVVVCYTNHALDQFLEHLVAVGITNIIRIGSQSSSEAMEGKNLRLLSKNIPRTRSESHTLGQSISSREEKEEHLQRQFGTLHNLRNKGWGGFDYHLRRMYPAMHRQFSGIDSDGYAMQGKKVDIFNNWKKGVRHGATKSAGGEPESSTGDLKRVIDQANENIWSLSSRERGTLLDHLVQEIRERVINGILDDLREDDDLARRVRDVYDEVDRRILATADVIGVTTSGLAKRIPVLRRINSKVVICEEAGEVLEAHMLSALIPSVEHLIQIGDHQQLRPQIVNHGLSMESHSGGVYQLDRSQFERLTTGEYGLPALPISQLNVQRRMRPDISRLVRKTLYERLKDHESVTTLPDVVGMSANVFWLDHENHEDNADQETRGRSRCNTWEVGMTHALVRHVVRQGVYESKDIAVLTPYVGQLQKLRAALCADFEVVLSDRDEEKLVREGHVEDQGPSEGETPRLQKKSINEFLRIATVDNFQGEEAKVIIVSLVRSNKDNKVGFLRTSNRINVLLSRAQHGMYLIGNSQTYSNVPMWCQVLSMLKPSGSVGPAFGLRCERHPELEISVSKPEDFEILSPQGGCRAQCSRRLPLCGHQCRSKCHSEALHRAFKCPLPCERLFQPCSHACPGFCGDPCGLCRTVIKNVQLPCGHTKDQLLCHQTQDLEKVRCTVRVDKVVPGCGHTVSVRCFEDVSSKDFVCSEPCVEVLPCGHTCHGTCGRCTVQREIRGPKTTAHQKCRVKCGRKYGSCHHSCPRECHGGEDCGLCQAPCEVKCAHSNCDKACHEACTPCVERCTWACEHHERCSLPCAAPCDRLPCSKRCPKMLDCGHQCPGLCGERCPTGYCQRCSDKGNARVDMLEFKSYAEIDLDESPIVVLSCGHFFTAETLDGHVGMGEVYRINPFGDFVSLVRSARLSQFVPRCPDCQSPIQQYATQRYNRVINQAVLDETSRRFIVSGDAQLELFASKIQDLETAYQAEDANTNTNHAPRRPVFPTTRPDSPMAMHQAKATQGAALARKIKIFIDQVSNKEHPVRKLYDATVNAMRNRSTDAQLSHLSIHDDDDDDDDDHHHQMPRLPPDQRIVTAGQVMLLQLEYITTKRDLAKPRPKAIPLALEKAHKFLKSCEGFITSPVSSSFPRLTIEAQLYHARIAFFYQSATRKSPTSGANETHASHATTHIETATAYLDQAEQLCTKGFQGSEHLRTAIEESRRLLGKGWYEEVTQDELAAIKAAMVSGRGGIATHSGHWYNCENGHPFAVGECGMPMQLAQCPECGARVGGQHHQPADGVTRATQMEG